jgi:hypothetical protein
MTRNDDIAVEELLAAYADGALDGDDRARVEAYLADHPEAADEVEALRAVINDTRATQPRPSHEPDWAAMRQAIADEVGGYGSAPAPSWWRRLLRPRYGLTAALAAAAVVVLIVSTGGERLTPAPTATSTGDGGAETRAETGEPLEIADQPLELRAARVADLDESELDDLLAELEPGALAPDADAPDADGEPVDDPVLTADEMAIWTADADADPLLEIGLFGDPELDDLLDDLSEEELSELDAFLSGKPG